MNDEEKKRFIIPLAEIIDFSDEDIITLSSGTADEDWGEDDNGELFS